MDIDVCALVEFGRQGFATAVCSCCARSPLQFGVQVSQHLILEPCRTASSLLCRCRSLKDGLHVIAHRWKMNPMGLAVGKERGAGFVSLVKDEW